MSNTLARDRVQCARSGRAACVFCVNYCQHCLPCPEGIEIGWVIWGLGQVSARGIEQVKEWYAEFPVKASAAPRSVWASNAVFAWSATRFVSRYDHALVSFHLLFCLPGYPPFLASEW